MSRGLILKTSSPSSTTDGTSTEKAVKERDVREEGKQRKCAIVKAEEEKEIKVIFTGCGVKREKQTFTISGNSTADRYGCELTDLL